MSWEHGVMTGLIIVCVLVHLFYKLLYKVCVDMISGAFQDENEKPLKLDNKQKEIIEILLVTANGMKWLAMLTLGVNVALAYYMFSDPPFILKGLAAFLNARVIMALWTLSKDVQTIGSYVDK